MPISTFMKFNKLKEMVVHQDDIEKALDKSEYLELSDDKQKVRRTTEVQLKQDIDEYTIYVVNLLFRKMKKTLTTQLENN